MQLSPTELASRIQSGESIPLLDVREIEEHQFVALPGSVLIPLGEIADRLGELAPWKSQTFVVYCHHGIRSARAVAFLRSQGFTAALNLAGGIDRWSTEVDPSAPRY
jgi:rhodanese-related sulfurtransferase